MAQVVRVVRRRLEPAAVDVAVIVRTDDGRFTHRRLQCTGDDLASGLPFLFAASPEALIDAGSPSNPRHVLDQHFAVAEQALAAAYSADPPADAHGWKTPEEFQLLLTDDETGLADSLRPEAERAGPLGAVIVGAGCVAVFAAVAWAGVLLNNWIHLDQIDGEGETADNVLSLLLAVVAGAVALWTAGVLDDRMSRRHLERERRRSHRRR